MRDGLVRPHPGWTLIPTASYARRQGCRLRIGVRYLVVDTREGHLIVEEEHGDRHIVSEYDLHRANFTSVP